MKFASVFVLFVLLLATAVDIHADGIPPDARIIVGHGDPPPPTHVGQFFPVPVDQITGGGTDDFVNSSTNQSIIELIFTAMLNKKDTINCVADDVIFGHCSVTIDKGNKVTIIFDDPLSGGILPGAGFFVDLNDSGKTTGSWKKDGLKHLDAQAVFATTVPEPGASLLLITGLGGVWLWRKRHASA
jgi:hypothetical protein